MQNMIQASKRWIVHHPIRIALLGLVLLLTAPWSAQGQLPSPCCALLAAGLSTISSALSSIVGGGLNSILGIEQQIQQFEQTVVFPQNLINQARALVGSLQGIFNQIEDLTQIPVNSATLPDAQQLEQNLLSHNPALIGQTSTVYSELYGAVPASTDASPQLRDIVDISDAAAQAAMKRAIEIDSLANLEIKAAGQLTQAVQNAAPGSAPIIEAQADAWLVRAHAYTQAAIADLMRLRSIELANASADIKMGATSTANLRQALVNLLQHN